MATFTAETYQNEYLAVGATEVNAIVTVTASGGGLYSGPAPAAAEIIIVDVSGSMDRLAKLPAAKKATAVAIDCIRESVRFAVIAGADQAVQVYPDHGYLVEATDRTKDEAKAAVARLKAGGGTAIGRWLEWTNKLFSEEPGSLKHAILLTDGRNESENSDQLDRHLSDCEGVFQCDCRGVGTDWEVSELREISSRLLGSVDIVANPEDLAADFQSMMEAAMGKELGDVALRLWMPKDATIRFVKQVAPSIEDLSTRRQDVNDLTRDYPTGAWGEESRDYHIAISVPAREVGEEMLAGRVSLVVEGTVLSQALIKAIWTDDRALSTRINREVAIYSGQEELAVAIQEGLEARKAGDMDTATVKLGRAVQLATETGNEATLKLLTGVVAIEDAANGTVRIRRQIDEAEEMTLDTRSTKTVRVEKRSP